MVICAIFGCSKRSGRDKVSFYRIPCVDMKRNYKFSELILKRQKLWITRIKREDLDQKKIKHARICELHFISGKPSSLQDEDNSDWAPSVNLGHQRTESSTATVSRYQRRIGRQKAQVQCTSSYSGQNNDDEMHHSDEVSSADIGEEVAPSTKTASNEDGKIDASSLTELTGDKIAHLEEIAKDYYSLQNDYYSLKNNKSVDFASINIDLFKNDEQINFYTGLVNAKLLRKLFNFVSPHANITGKNKLNSFQEFLLFLLRIRLNLETQDLGYRFNISQETASRIFNKWTDIMYIQLKKLVFWPERENLLKTMPQSFKSAFDGHVSVILDCFEITINRPSSLKARAKTWSNYKQRNTVKFLIGITAQGMISFISLGWGGRTSDKFITEQCGILNHLIPGDIVLADRRFNNLNSVVFYCAKLVLPASARGVKQLNPIDIEKTRKIASLRIHVERVIGHLRKKFHILKGALPLEMCITSKNDVAQIDKIVHICSALVNLMPSIIC